MTDLRDKTAIVTGAAGGIGRAVVQLLHEQGANVVAADVNEDGLQALSENNASKLQCLAGDISDRDYTEALKALALESFGGLDVAVLNAGMDGQLKPIFDIEPASFDRVLQVNVGAVFAGIQIFGQAMKQSGGSIVVTSSINGLRAFQNTSPYTTSKMAVLGLVRAAANDLAQYKIRVNAVHPGLIDTPMLRRAEEGLAHGQADELREALSATVAMKRVGRAEEIAEAMLFFASERSSYITGASLLVDGGMTKLLST